MPVCDYLARLFKQRRLFQIKITLTLGGGALIRQGEMIPLFATTVIKIYSIYRVSTKIGYTQFFI